MLVDRTRGEKLAKALVFLPMAISMVGASIIWKFMYEYRQDAARPQIGLLNQVLVWIGLDPYQFIITEPWNTFFLIVVMIWIQAGFAMTVLSAAIKSVPDDIVEAAQIDGATGFKLFRKVTVPTIRPAVVVVLTTIAMGSLKAFDIVRTMTGGNFGTSVVANEFYTQSFRQGEARRRHRCRTGRHPVHHHHPGHRLQRPADAAFGGNAMSMSGSAVELPITTDRTPEEALSPRQLKKQLRLQEAKTKLSSPWASGLAIMLAILWTIPTFGLFVTSFRPPADIQTSGWWTFFANPGITFENYTNAWSNSAGGLGGFFINSFVIVFPAVLIPISLALLAAYCFAWIDFPGAISCSSRSSRCRSCRSRWR